MEKTLNIKDAQDTKEKVSDVIIRGNVDAFALLCKASSQEQGWMKSTKICNLHNGCIVQVSTQQRNPDGSYVVAEALTFVPDVNMVTWNDGSKSLEHIYHPENNKQI